MDNREVTLPNPTTLKNGREINPFSTEKIIKIVKEIPNLTEEAELKLPSDEVVIKMEAETLTIEHDDSEEIMMSAKKIFVEKFENAPVEEKKAAIVQFYNALDAVYEVKYRGASVPIVFSKGGNYAFNHDGFIRIPLDILEKQTSDKAVFSILHEYRHAMQSSFNVHSSGMGLEAFTRLSHDMRVEEIDATKFAFTNMDKLGFDKTKNERYSDWQKAIRITDTFDLLKLNYSQETFENMLSIYKLLDEYTFQTNRSDLMSDNIKGKFNKIRAKIKFKSNITIAKEKFTELEKKAKLTNDKFLLNVVSEIRTDWSQFHL